MIADDIKHIPRRRFLKTAGVTALAAGAGPAVIIPGRAQPKTLKILQLKEYVPAFNDWYEHYVSQWGEQNNIKIQLDLVGGESLAEATRNSAEWLQEYDAIQLVIAGEDAENHFINHREIHEECEHRYGKPIEGLKAYDYNPKTQNYFRFTSAFGPSLLIYRKDLWDVIGQTPNSWDDIRYGGRRIKFSSDHPVGISMISPNSNSHTTLHTLLQAFGASLQDAANRPTLKSPQALDAFQFTKALFDEAMPDDLSDMLSWDSTGNNRYMIAGEGSLTIDPVSITRSAENIDSPVADQLVIGAIPEGPAKRLGVAAVHRSMAISNRSQNLDAAKQFLVDYIGQSRDWLQASRFFLCPVFPETVPDLHQLFGNDTSVMPPDKYQIMSESYNWTMLWAYPGNDNPALREVWNSRLLPTAVAQMVTAKLTPEEALTQADEAVKKIYDKWRALGKI